MLWRLEDLVTVLEGSMYFYRNLRADPHLTIKPLESSQFNRIGTMASFTIQSHLAFKIDLSDLVQRFTLLYNSCEDLTSIYKHYNETFMSKLSHDHKLTSVLEGNKTGNWHTSLIYYEDQLLDVSIQVRMGDALTFCHARRNQARRKLKLVKRILVNRRKRDALNEQIELAYSKKKSKHRQKRFWAGLGTIVSLLVSGYNTYEIMKLSDQLNGVVQQQNNIIQVLSADHSQLKEHQAKILALQAASTALSSSVANLRTISNIDSLLLRLVELSLVQYTDFDYLADALLKLTEGNLSPMLWKSEDLVTVLEGLKKQAKERGYDLAVSEASEIFQMPNGYSTTGDEITIFVKIPLTSTELLYDVFVFTSKAYLLPPPVSKFAIIDPGEYPFLAVSRSETSYKLLSSQEMSQCQTVGSAYFCPHSNIVQGNFEVNCLAALFQHKYSLTNKICNFKILPDIAIARQLSQSTFVIHSPQEIHFKLVCRGQYINSITILHTQEIHFLDDCSLNSQSLSIQGSGTQIIENNQILTFPSMNESLAETFRKLKEEPQALPYYQKFLKNHPATADDILQKWTIHKTLHGMTTPHYLGHAMNGLAIFISLVIIIFIIVAIWRRHRQSRIKDKRECTGECHEMTSTDD